MADKAAASEAARKVAVETIQNCDHQDATVAGTCVTCIALALDSFARVEVLRGRKDEAEWWHQFWNPTCGEPASIDSTCMASGDDCVCIKKNKRIADLQQALKEAEEAR